MRFKLSSLLFLTPMLSSGGANYTLSNLTNPTAINQSLTFDTTQDYSISLADVNVTGTTHTLRILGQTNINQTSSTAGAGNVWIESGSNYGLGMNNNYNSAVYIGAYYEGGPNGAAGNYPFIYVGTVDGGNSLGTRFLDPDTLEGGYASGTSTGGTYWQIFAHGGYYQLGNDHNPQMMTSGTHGNGVPVFPTVTVFDGEAAFNARISTQTENVTLTGSAGTAVCSQPFAGTTYTGHSGYKKVVCYLSGYTDTGTHTYTFVNPFDNTPYAYGDSAVVSGATVTTSTVKFTTVTQTGYLFLEGL